MPLYEYKCNKCGEKYELRRSIFASSKDKTVCPECGAIESERIYSIFSNSGSEGGACSNTPTRRFG